MIETREEDVLVIGSLWLRMIELLCRNCELQVAEPKRSEPSTEEMSRSFVSSVGGSLDSRGCDCYRCGNVERRRAGINVGRGVQGSGTKECLEFKLNHRVLTSSQIPGSWALRSHGAK